MRKMLKIAVTAVSLTGASIAAAYACVEFTYSDCGYEEGCHNGSKYIEWCHYFGCSAASAKWEGVDNGSYPSGTTSASEGWYSNDVYETQMQCNTTVELITCYTGEDCTGDKTCTIGDLDFNSEHDGYTADVEPACQTS